MSLLDGMQSTIVKAKMLDKEGHDSIYILAQTILAVGQVLMLELDEVRDQLGRLSDNVETLRRTIAQK